MKKKYLMLCLVLAMLIPSNVYAATNSKPISTVDTDTKISPLFMYTYTKTVINYYSSINSVPEYIDYTEYLSGFGWCVGSLKLQSVVRKGNGYNATYTGTMYAPVS